MLLKLLGLPVTLPMAGIRFCLDQVAQIAETELTDDTAVREQLLLLQVQLDEGEISEEEYQEQEAVLMQRLREIRAYREQRIREQAAALAGEAEPAEPVEPGRRRVVVETQFGDVDQP